LRGTVDGADFLDEATVAVVHGVALEIDPEVIDIAVVVSADVSGIDLFVHIHDRGCIPVDRALLAVVAGGRAGVGGVCGRDGEEAQREREQAGSCQAWEFLHYL